MTLFLESGQYVNNIVDPMHINNSEKYTQVFRYECEEYLLTKDNKYRETARHAVGRVRPHRASIWSSGQARPRRASIWSTNRSSRDSATIIKFDDGTIRKIIYVPEFNVYLCQYDDKIIIYQGKTRLRIIQHPGIKLLDYFIKDDVLIIIYVWDKKIILARVLENFKEHIMLCLADDNRWTYFQISIDEEITLYFVLLSEDNIIQFLELFITPHWYEHCVARLSRREHDLENAKLVACDNCVIIHNNDKARMIGHHDGTPKLQIIETKPIKSSRVLSGLILLEQSDGEILVIDKYNRYTL